MCDIPLSQVAEQVHSNAETEAELLISDFYFEFSSQVTGWHETSNKDKLEHLKHRQRSKQQLREQTGIYTQGLITKQGTAGVSRDQNKEGT